MYRINKITGILLFKASECEYKEVHLKSRTSCHTEHQIPPKSLKNGMSFPICKGLCDRNEKCKYFHYHAAKPKNKNCRMFDSCDKKLQYEMPYITVEKEDKGIPKFLTMLTLLIKLFAVFIFIKFYY